MSSLAAPPTPHSLKDRALPTTAGHGDLRSGSCIAILHFAIMQACAEGFPHILRVLLAVLHGERGLVPLHGPTVDVLQGQRVLWIVRVLLMSVRRVVMGGLACRVAVVLLLLLLLSFLSLLFVAGPLLVLDGGHSPLHRALLKTLKYTCPYCWISVSTAGPLRVP